MLKKVLLLCLVLMIVIPVTAQAQPQNISVYLDGKALSFDVPPTVEKGRTLVPLRVIFEALGARVAYDSVNNTVTATKGDTTISLPIGNINANVNGKIKKLDVPAKVVSGRTMVPIRFISEALGASVEWDAVTSSVFITGKFDFDNMSFTISDPQQIAEFDSDWNYGNVTSLADGSFFIHGDNPSMLLYYNASERKLKQVPGLYSDEYEYFSVYTLSDGRLLLVEMEQSDGKDYWIGYILKPDTGEKTKLPIKIPINFEVLFISSLDEFVYCDDIDGQRDLFKTDINGNVLRLTNTKELDESWPSWSPDGKSIAFVTSPKDENKLPYISIINSDGSGQRNLNYPVDSATDLTWLPDGKSLTYVVKDKKGSEGIWVVTADGSSKKHILIQDRMSYIQLSPKGNRMCVVDPISSQVIVFDNDGSNIMRLYNPEFPVQWSMAGDKLLYFKEGTLYQWDLEQRQIIPLIDGDILDFWQKGSDIYLVCQNAIYKSTLENLDS